MRGAQCLTIIAAALLAPACSVHAQVFPGKIVRLVIPFPVGGSSDANARIIGPYLTERWKQQVIVEPRPGAATVVGTDHVAKSAPDGHTLLINSTQFVQSPATFAKLPYDPYTDIARSPASPFHRRRSWRTPLCRRRRSVSSSRSRVPGLARSTWARPEPCSPRTTSSCSPR